MNTKISACLQPNRVVGRPLVEKVLTATEKGPLSSTQTRQLVEDFKASSESARCDAMTLLDDVAKAYPDRAAGIRSFQGEVKAAGVSTGMPSVGEMLTNLKKTFSTLNSAASERNRKVDR